MQHKWHSIFFLSHHIRAIKESCKVINLWYIFKKPGKSSVIRVVSTRWMAHTTVLKNLFNGIDAHQTVYCTILEEQDYSAAQTAKAKFFLNSLNDFKFMPFPLYNIRHLPAFGNFLKGMIKVRHISNTLSTNSL